MRVSDVAGYKLSCRFLVLTVGLGLGACQQRDMEELEKFVAEVKAREVVYIGELPEFPPEEVYLYPDKGVDPFQPFKTDAELAQIAIDTSINRPPCLRPDAHRVKEQLEGFPLDALDMKGTMTPSDGDTYGLVVDRDNNVYKVRVGDYIGQNYGKINLIEGAVIQLTEMVDDGTGCYIERPNALRAKLTQ